MAAELIGYPVALKSADIALHKTDIGGVRLNIGSPDELKEAFRAIKGDCFLVQRMVEIGHEVFIGGKDDTEFGPVILLGWVEYLLRHLGMLCSGLHQSRIERQAI